MLARIRSVAVVSDASPTALSFLSQEKRWGRKECWDAFGASYLCTQARPNVLVWRSTRKSPHGRLTTRRLIRWVSNLQLVALERLPSIERAAEILIDLTFLRGTKAPLKGELAAARLTERWMQICCNLSVSASPSHLPFQGRLWTACGLFYPAEACFFPDFFLAVRPARLMMAARAATRAQPTRPETEVPAALSLPAKL